MEFADSEKLIGTVDGVSITIIQGQTIPIGELSLNGR